MDVFEPVEPIFDPVHNIIKILGILVVILIIVILTRKNLSKKQKIIISLIISIVAIIVCYVFHTVAHGFGACLVITGA